MKNIFRQLSVLMTIAFLGVNDAFAQFKGKAPDMNELETEAANFGNLGRTIIFIAGTLGLGIALVFAIMKVNQSERGEGKTALISLIISLVAWIVIGGSMLNIF